MVARFPAIDVDGRIQHSGLGRYTGAKAGQVDHRLEHRTGLPARVENPVELRAPVVAPAHHGAKGARLVIGDERRLIASVAIAYRDGHGAERSNSDIRRLIQQGGVQLDGEKFSDPAADLPDKISGRLLRLDKKRSVCLL